MADNVSVNFGADASKMASELEKAKDKISSLTNKIETMGSKSKASSRESANGFKSVNDQLSSMAIGAVSVASAYALVKQSITAVIEKAKELRALRDESAISTGASTNKINKEFMLDTREQQAEMRSFLYDRSQKNKLKIEDVSKFIEQGANEGLKKESFYAGKMDPFLELQSATDIKDPKQLYMLLQTIAKKKGKKLDDMSEGENQGIAEMLATQGGDVGELNTFFSKMGKNKRGQELNFEQILALREMAESSSYGKEKRNASMVDQGFQKGGVAGAAKATGGSIEEMNMIIERNKSSSLSDLNRKFAIQNQSREAELNFADNAKKIALSKDQERPLEKALDDRIRADQEDQGMGYSTRTADDMLRGVIGNDNFIKFQQWKSETLYGEGTGQKLSKTLDLNYVMQKKEAGDSPVSTSKDSK